MLISHQKKFIFTKTARTASTSIEIFFERFCMPEDQWEMQEAREVHESEEGIIGFRGVYKGEKKWYNHMSAKLIKEQIGDEIWDDYFKFTIIRNPYPKQISGWSQFIKNRATRKSKLKGCLNHPHLFLKYLMGQGESASFQQWILDGNKVWDRDKYMIDDEVAVDFFIEYENLERDLKKVCQKLDINYDQYKLPQFKTGYRSKNTPSAAYYDKRTRAIIERQFDWEIKRFNYAFE